ncbi:ABC transporter substrate-binding protein [Geodermatophilus sp. DSM 45219]|uniref:ABC transporter substrate-binding protein n=1 Tax=Geodermatophilus sp. DSM 45219 TaxID=1881103 RepID=UPI0008899D44|nr:ABC transporter substrate-binding protein [Geodermatophilus sp. DSM 45219]SDN39428.1 iron complex transport system substrate-binding protein [Geodermatophilus sp. DSM 45219]
MPRSRSARRLTPVALLLPLVLALPACGSDPAAPEDPGTGTAGGAFPVTVTGDDGELTLDARPETIVSMSASATEMLFAIGAGEQVEAVDSTSDFPADAPTTDLSAFTPNAEAIAGYSPDLVVLSDDVNGVVDALDALAVPTLLLGAADTLDESYAQIEVLGGATGHAEEAADVVAGVQDRITAAVASVPDSAQGMRVYHELDPGFYSATSDTFIGAVYDLFGLENVADGAADPAGGYPQLSAEYVVGQAPDLVVLADTVCCGESAETLAQRPAFDTVPAVQEGRVLEADDAVASRWGPRTADFAEALAAELRG